MSELKTVVLSSLHPNPFRNLDEFPYVPEKIERLQESIAAEGFWEGVIARPARSGYELAFGHHRVEAARLTLGESARVPIIVRDLGDEQMLRFMDRENAEEHGWDFYDVEVQSVRAAVKWLGSLSARPASWPEAHRGERERSDTLRLAPSFRRGSGGEMAPTAQVYTAQDLAEFLKRTVGADHKPQRGVLTALDALELLEEGALRVGAIRGLTRAEARDVVGKAKAAAEADRERRAAAAREEAEAAERKRKQEEIARAKLAEAERNRADAEAARRAREAAQKAAAEAARAETARAEAAARREAAAARELAAKTEALNQEMARLAAAKKDKTCGRTGADRNAERKLKKRTAPGLKPDRAVDLTPRGEDVARALARMVLPKFPKDLAPLLALAYDPAHSFTRGVAERIDAELVRVQRWAKEAGERRNELSLIFKMRKWGKR